jgi:hypothetical protein
MQYKNNKQIKKDIRRAHEQLGALVLILGTLAGTVALSTEARRVVTGLAVRPAFAVVEHTSRENETARHPVSLASALRSPHISGY